MPLLNRSTGPLPTFVIIGAQKSGTRWLRYNLGLHPEIYTAPREPAFFNHGKHFHRKGLRWYRRQFEGWSGEPIVGEATPGYMIPRHRPESVARRIDETLPNVRLIAILRNPIDRAQSAMVHHIRRGRLAPDVRLLDLVRRTPPHKDRLGLVTGGWYHANLMPFRRRFEDRLLVLLHDDIVDEPEAVYEQALSHVGASPGFVPPDLPQVVFSNQHGDSRPVRGLSDDERVDLYRYFHDDVRRLQMMIERDLSIWKPDWPSMNAPNLLTYCDDAARWITVRLRDAVSSREREKPGDAEPAQRSIATRLIREAASLAWSLQQGESPEAFPWRERGPRAGTDLLAAYQEAAASLHAAIAEPRYLDRSITTQFGAVSGRRAVWSTLTYQVFHGWELATTADPEPPIPQDLAETAVAFARLMARFPTAAAGAAESTNGKATMGGFVAYLERALTP